MSKNDKETFRFESNKQENVLEKAVANSLSKLVNYLDNLTEYGNRELKSISVIENDKYLRNLLTKYEKNKKHVNRKFSKEILKAIKLISNYQSKDDNSGIFSRLFNRGESI